MVVPQTNDEDPAEEQEQQSRQAAQEREDLELARRLQAQFAAMQQVAGRTRRGGVNRLPSPLLEEVKRDEERMLEQQRLELAASGRRPVK